MTKCPESEKGHHQWSIQEITDPLAAAKAIMPGNSYITPTRFKAYICPCGAWRRITLLPENEVPIDCN